MSQPIYYVASIQDATSQCNCFTLALSKMKDLENAFVILPTQVCFVIERERLVSETMQLSLSIQGTLKRGKSMYQSRTEFFFQIGK